MTEDIDLLDLVEKSKANDLAFLLKAKEQSKARMKQNPTHPGQHFRFSAGKGRGGRRIPAHPRRLDGHEDFQDAA
ncbi:hypothetical protein [uncultured Mailhella sp.]|uniref:hypothetical protein n=1 Tax=uncultured Mailhella sp. TaxID=1981031 RepID=UPI0025EF8E80|nr:hypothetical protein [uncultured Mailhella sp.]